ncbi:MAG: DEAD/DEAH box helicase [Xanthomonadales bacterium]|nr:DEAD/DEAH box helicase [Xanthomonadales bacterium]
MSHFERLHPSLRQWVWRQGWPSLRPVQEQAIPEVLAGKDVVIAAPTAGGKTEAAFLPILSEIADDPGRGVKVLCVSPLKALINDQARRLEDMAEAVGLRCQPWHGDVTQGKAGFWKNPPEILIITPESLEAMLMRRVNKLVEALASLRFQVVDELHAFFDSPRGAQLLSLLNRVDQQIGRRVPRVALSATAGDLQAALQFLRPGGSESGAVVEVSSGGGELKIGFMTTLRELETTPISLPSLPEETPQAESVPVPGWSDLPPPEADEPPEMDPVADHLFQCLRGRSNLVFANARNRVESLAATLAERCELAHLPQEFFAHHGSLSRDHRTEVELRLREGKLPSTVVCTSTLELGIDLGDIHTVAQVGPAPSVAALKQRVGRSGRRPGAAQILRQYVELRKRKNAHLIDGLHLPLLQSIATIEGLRAGEFEPPWTANLQLSTLTQQILSVLVERGAMPAAHLHRRICAPQGPFARIDAGRFAEILRALGANAQIEQLPGGEIALGEAGERLTEDYRFYATFVTPEEYTVFSASGKRLGTIPVDDPIVPGQSLIFAGRRWRVLNVDTERLTIRLEPGRGGRPPMYASGGMNVHERLHRRMQALLLDDPFPAYLDPKGRQCLADARQHHANTDLGTPGLYRTQTDLILALWGGTRASTTLAIALSGRGVEAMPMGPFVLVPAEDAETLAAVIAELIETMPTQSELAEMCPPLAEEKFESLLSPALISLAIGSRSLDREGAMRALQRLVE